MKYKIPLFISLIIFAASCKSYRERKKAETVVADFFRDLKQSDNLKLIQLYKGFKNLESYYKSDSATIVSSEYKKGIISVLVHNRFTNGFGKLNERDITLYLKDSNNNISIIDSKGLTDFEDNDLYTLGIKTGCITSIDSTDQLIITSINDKAKKLMLKEGVNMYQELREKVIVTSWNWESMYFSSGASGHGVVKNFSDFTIPNLKYKVIYMDNAGNEITSDDGYVCYNNLEAGESKSFSFYTSYTGGAHRASIKLVFDENLIIKYLANKSWTGNEWNNFKP